MIYYHFDDDDQIWLVTVYDKGEADDLSAEQRRAMKAAIGREKAARRARRAAR